MWRKIRLGAGVVSLVGSSNLDPLSLHRNYELNLVVACTRTGAAMRELFDSEIIEAVERDLLRLREWEGRRSAEAVTA